jgi:hypothetical protein
MRTMRNKMIKTIVCSTLILLSIFIVSCRKSDYVIVPSEVAISDNGGGTGSVTWEKGKTYLLEGKIFVNDGQTLTIEPGAVIRFKRGKGAAASALIVSRGGKIIAEGTSVDPIIFTTEGDDLKGSVAVEEFGLWGGLVVLGNATINTPNGEGHIEGIPLSEPRAVFGGDNDEDDSGILKYISIRHGGTELGKDNEINGLTLGGVGSKTIIENIEVISNADDGIEIFGGTVNLKRIVVAYCDDDAIDIDLGYRGTMQHICIVQHELWGDKHFEIDGAEIIKTAIPHSVPIIYNATAIGRGENLSNHCISFWDNAGGTIANSVFINQSKGVYIEYSASRNSSYTQWTTGLLQIKSSVFFHINNNSRNNLFQLIALNDEDILTQQQQLDHYFELAGNRFADPGFKRNENGYSLISDEKVLTENVASPPQGNEFLEKVPYIGAFGSYNWLSEWTLTSQSGIIW